MSDFWILNPDGSLERVDDVRVWGRWFEANQEARVVKQEEVEAPGGSTFRVSTVFLGVDMSYFSAEPLLFETMIFGLTDTRERYCERYPSLDAAKAGHERACQWVRSGLEARV